MLIIPTSSSVVGEPGDRLRAIDRFDGIFLRAAKKSIVKSKRRDIDILFLSPIFGLVEAAEQVPFHKPMPGGWRSFQISTQEAENLRIKNSSKLRALLEKDRYSEAYLNVGQKYLALLDLSPLSNLIVTFSKGGGPGPKAAHMKAWIEGHLS